MNETKLKLIGKSLLEVTVIVGGKLVAGIFPSNIIIAVLEAGEPFKTGKHENKKRKIGKEDLKEVEAEFTKRKTVREFIEQQQPSAPPLYPGL